MKGKLQFPKVIRLGPYVSATEWNRDMAENSLRLADMKVLFHRPHYDRLADVFRSLPMDAGIVQVIMALSEMLARDNPGFDPGRFMEMALDGK